MPQGFEGHGRRPSTLGRWQRAFSSPSPIAERGLVAMRTAGLDVDVQIGLSAEQLLLAVKGVRALVIRSATR